MCGSSITEQASQKRYGSPSCSYCNVCEIFLWFAHLKVAGSQLVLVGSTLVIAALFQPLRRRLQHTIDRRFYRQKYDASRVIERFSANLRSEVDLAQLSEQIVAVVQET